MSRERGLPRVARALVIAQPTKRKQPHPSPAWRLYTGSQQRLVQQGLEAVWDRFGFRQGIDELILSPWYGPVEPEAVLAPYDFTWKGRPPRDVAAIVREGNMVPRLQELTHGYDLILVLLSKVYLAPLELASLVPGRAPQRWLFFASGEGLPFVPPAPNVRVVPAGVPEARREGVKVLDLKAHLFRRLCLRGTAEGADLSETLEAEWRAAVPHE